MKKLHYFTDFGVKYGNSTLPSQDRLDPVFNKGQDASLCESVHQTSTCFRCYPSNQKLHANNQQEHPHLIPYTLKKLKRPLSSHSFD